MGRESLKILKKIILGYELRVLMLDSSGFSNLPSLLLIEYNDLDLSRKPYSYFNTIRVTNINR